MQNVNYQNAYQQWQSYANELMQLANEAQSMGLTDLANRLKAQASTANQVAQGYLVNYVLTSPNVRNFISTYNQYMQLLNNQPNPQTNPQAYLTWLSQVGWRNIEYAWVGEQGWLELLVCVLHDLLHQLLCVLPLLY